MARGLTACTIRFDDAGGRLRYRVPGHKHRVECHADKRQRSGKAAMLMQCPQAHNDLMLRSGQTWTQEKIRSRGVALAGAHSDNSQAHGFMSLSHVLHTPSCVAFLHRSLRHVEMRDCLFLLRGIGHLGDLVIQLLHMGVGAFLAAGVGRGKACQKAATRDILG
jgi:hypothetical protein